MLTLQKTASGVRDWFFWGIILLLVAAGLYLLWLVASPWLSGQSINPTSNATTQRMAATAQTIGENRLYIPKINVSVPYARGDANVLENGAWWRAPESGNPKDGGNFVLAAHRFVMGWTPQQTERKSPFFNIDQLRLKDKLYVDYEGTRYTYLITRIHEVAPTATEIEAPTPGKNQLTLYSCTLGGSNDGRAVIVATLQP